MTPSNISIVFAPNILRPHGNDAITIMQDSRVINRVFQEMIVQYNDIFQNEPEPSKPSIPSKPNNLFPTRPPAGPLPEIQNMDGRNNVAVEDSKIEISNDSYSPRRILPPQPNIRSNGPPPIAPPRSPAREIKEQQSPIREDSIKPPNVPVRGSPTSRGRIARGSRRGSPNRGQPQKPNFQANSPISSPGRPPLGPPQSVNTNPPIRSSPPSRPLPPQRKVVPPPSEPVLTNTTENCQNSPKISTQGPISSLKKPPTAGRSPKLSPAKP